MTVMMMMMMMMMMMITMQLTDAVDDEGDSDGDDGVNFTHLFCFLIVRFENACVCIMECNF